MADSVVPLNIISYRSRFSGIAKYWIVALKIVNLPSHTRFSNIVKYQIAAKIQIILYCIVSDLHLALHNIKLLPCKQREFDLSIFGIMVEQLGEGNHHVLQ